MRKRVRWLILGVLSLLLVTTMILITREPPPPYAFLSKYPVIEKKETKDGSLRFIVVKGNYDDVVRDATNELATSSNLRYSSSSMASLNGIEIKMQSVGSGEGRVTISTDLSGNGLTGNMSFSDGDPTKSGYCSIAYTRPKNLFDKMMDWVTGLFGQKKPSQQVRLAISKT